MLTIWVINPDCVRNMGFKSNRATMLSSRTRTSRLSVSEIALLAVSCFFMPESCSPSFLFFRDVVARI